MGLFDSLFGSSGGSSQSSKSYVWPTQEPYLGDIYGLAQSGYRSDIPDYWYQGDRYANAHQMALGGVGDLNSWALGGGNYLANNMARTANIGMNRAQAYGGNAQALYNYAAKDPTQQLINQAGQYANNPYMNGMIDAVGRDITRSFFENDRTGNNLNAVGAGGMNSSRAGIAEGILARGAQDRLGDISAQLRGGAYQSGLGLAAQMRDQRIQAQLNANAQLGNLYGMSGAMGGYANQMALSNANSRIQGGQFLQQDMQNQLNADMARWQAMRFGDWNLLGMYQGAIGNPTVLTNSSMSSSEGSPGILGTALGVGSTLMGMPYVGTAIAGGVGLI